MDHETEFALSFYKKIDTLSEAHDVDMVKHVETGEIFVMKRTGNYDMATYRLLQERNFPWIPRIRDLTTDGDSLIIIEDYVAGRTLAEITEDHRLEEKDTADMVMQLCNILKPLHGNDPKIIHRDIKPSNIIIDNEGSVHLIDFDASRSYEPGKDRDTVLMGTLDYAAPEQYGFSQSDERTDIYSVGILMKTMLTGRADSAADDCGKLAGIVEKCTRMDPNKRYSDVDELAQALKSVTLKKLGDSWTPPGFRTKKPLHMILASAWYFTLAALFFVPNVDNMNPYEYYTGIATLVLSLLLFTFYIADYRGFREVFPYKSKADSRWQMLRYILASVIIFLAPISAWSIIVALIAG